jgi:hypothetical protein
MFIVLEPMQIDHEWTNNQNCSIENTIEQDTDTIDESKIDDIEQRLTLVTRKYLLMKRRIFAKQSRTRALHLGQDRYRRRYWHFSNLPGIYVEGLRTGDVSSNDIKDIVENATKQRLDRKLDGNTNDNTIAVRPTNRKRQQTKVINSCLSISISDMSTPVEIVTVEIDQNDNEVEQLQPLNACNPNSDDLVTMDLSSFCLAVKRDDDNNNEQLTSDYRVESCSNIKIENNDQSNMISHDNENNHDNMPLDLTCSKLKRSCQEDYWTQQATSSVPLMPMILPKIEPFHELNDLATAAMALQNIKQENIIAKNILDLTNAKSIKQESSQQQFKQIEQTIRERFQYAQPLPIPEGKSINVIR